MKTPGDFLAEMTPGPRRMFILMDEFQEVSEGGVILPEEHSEQHRVATIGQVGPGCYHGYMPGDQVVVGWFAGTVLHLMKYGISGDRYRIVMEDEVLCWLGLTDEEKLERYGQNTRKHDSASKVEAGEQTGPEVSH